MVARVIQGVVSEGKMDEVERLVESALGPNVLEQKGSRGLLLLTHRGSGQAISISLWEDAEAMQGESSEFLEHQLEQVLHLLEEAPSVRDFQVSAQL